MHHKLENRKLKRLSAGSAAVGLHKHHYSAGCNILRRGELSEKPIGFSPRYACIFCQVLCSLVPFSPAQVCGRVRPPAGLDLFRHGAAAELCTHHSKRLLMRRNPRVTTPPLLRKVPESMGNHCPVPCLAPAGPGATLGSDNPRTTADVSAPVAPGTQTAPWISAPEPPSQRHPRGERHGGCPGSPGVTGTAALPSEAHGEGRAPERGRRGQPSLLPHPRGHEENRSQGSSHQAPRPERPASRSVPPLTRRCRAASPPAAAHSGTGLRRAGPGTHHRSPHDHRPLPERPRRRCAANPAFCSQSTLPRVTPSGQWGDSAGRWWAGPR